MSDTDTPTDTADLPDAVAAVIGVEQYETDAGFDSAKQMSDIETVMVDGKVVMEGGQVMGVDEAGLIRQATEAHLWQKERFAAQNPEGKPASVLFPTTYPVI